MNIKADNLGYRELDILCSGILNLIDNENFNSFVSTSDEITFGYDLKYDSPYVEDGHFTYYFSSDCAGDFE